jgi:hypothetical protein
VRVADAGQRLLRPRASEQGAEVDRSLVFLEPHQVRVAVDQARRHREGREIDDGRPGGIRASIRPHGLDPIPSDPDRLGATHLARYRIEQAAGPDHGGEDLGHGSRRYEGSAVTSATSICALCSRPE